ncbi:MAG TPA: BON domain-containing protein [Phenylobacterium sp.]|jgi:osmotically-inducible protein OsmY
MEDKTLKQLIDDELTWEPSVDAANVAATVGNGIVTLNGHVPTYAQKVAAERAVTRVKGVRGFVDHIEVQPFGPGEETDEAIAQRISNMVNWDVTIPDDSVTVQVSDGRVTLMGQVDWQYQRYAAERGVRALAGVRTVTNQIAVKPHVQASDIKRRIESAFERHANLAIGKIRVSVEEDKVRLDGEVPAWTDRDMAERAAWAAPGVRAVDDHIKITI